MADIRLQVNEVKLCIKNARLYLHGVRRDAEGRVVDHVDVILPWNFQRAITNLDNIDYHALDGLDGTLT